MNRSRSHSHKYGMKFLRPRLPIPTDGPNHDPRHIPIKIIVGVIY
jgi:hypothetical protein